MKIVRLAKPRAVGPAPFLLFFLPHHLKGACSVREIPGRSAEPEPTEQVVHDVPVHRIMSREVIRVGPDTSVEAVISVLLERGISGAPVVDAGGKPIGMISKTDLVRTHHEADDPGQTRVPVRRVRIRGFEIDLGPGFHEEDLASALVRDVMLPIAFTLPEDAPVSRAAALMAYEGVHRIPVVSASGEVVGIVTTLDVLRWLSEELLGPDTRATSVTGR